MAERRNKQNVESVKSDGDIKADRSNQSANDELILNAEQIARKEALESHLSAVSLTLRKDSDLCWDFILYGQQSLNCEQIRDQMCKAHYLHNYCNFWLGRHIAYNTTQARKIKLEFHKWQELINHATLLTTKLKQFPEEWPWLKGITAAEWKKANDLTDNLTKQSKYRRNRGQSYRK